MLQKLPVFARKFPVCFCYGWKFGQKVAVFRWKMADESGVTGILF
jgi:hypothetical protein